MIKKIVIIILVLIAVISAAVIGLKSYTKSFSPLEVVTYQDNTLKIDVQYCRPFKKGRTVFPDLVPYGVVWRTGANEATQITTSQDLNIYDQQLPKGTYSFWTIPGESEWQIIFNKEYGQWGVTLENVANRNPELDVLTTTVPVYKTENDIEQFTIQFEDTEELIEMLLLWENTIVVVPIHK